VKQGVEPAFAREQALQRFGDIESAKRQLYASARQREDRLRWRTAVDDVRRDGFAAAQRTREMAIRAALGAQRSSLLRLMIAAATRIACSPVRWRAWWLPTG
jgi:hypothetical protein